MRRKQNCLKMSKRVTQGSKMCFCCCRTGGDQIISLASGSANGSNVGWREGHLLDHQDNDHTVRHQRGVWSTASWIIPLGARPFALCRPSREHPCGHREERYCCRIAAKWIFYEAGHSICELDACLPRKETFPPNHMSQNCYVRTPMA